MNCARQSFHEFQERRASAGADQRATGIQKHYVGPHLFAAASRLVKSNDWLRQRAPAIAELKSNSCASAGADYRRADIQMTDVGPFLSSAATVRVKSNGSMRQRAPAYLSLKSSWRLPGRIYQKTVARGNMKSVETMRPLGEAGQERTEVH